MILVFFAVSCKIGYGQYSTFSNAKFTDAFNGAVYPLANLTYNKVELSYKNTDFSNSPFNGYISDVFIRFNVGTEATINNFKISMGQVPLSDFKDTTLFTKPLTVVYGPTKQNVVADNEDWYKITLQTQFYYDTSKVLIVAFEQDSISGYGGIWSYIGGKSLPRYRIYGKSKDSVGKGSDKVEYDFGFVENNLVPNYVTVCEVVLPKYNCAYSAPQDLVMSLCNAGNTDISSVYIGWSIDGVVQTSHYCSPGPKYDSTMDVKLGTILISKGENHILKAWTFLPNGLNNSLSNQDTSTWKNWLPDTLAPQINLLGRPFDSVQVAYPGYLSKYSDSVLYKDNIEDQIDINLKVSGSFYDSFPNLQNINKLGNYKIIYTATDQCGNSSSKTRQIKVYDHVPPVVSLVGDPVVSVCRWADYHDAGYVASDNYYNGPDIRIDTFGTFVTNGHSTTPGSYFLRYRAVDGSGNEGLSNHRTIFVIPADSFGCKSGIFTALGLKNNITIYPNPGNGLFTINSTIPGFPNMKISVLDMLGKEIGLPINNFFAGNQIQIDLSQRPPGMYFVHIVAGDETANVPIVVRR